GGRAQRRRATGAMGPPCQATGRASAEIDGRPELVAEDASHGGPQLVAGLPRDPGPVVFVPVEMPGVALGGHPDLARSAVRVHHVARAVTELDREDVALELGLDLVVL